MKPALKTMLKTVRVMKVSRAAMGPTPKTASENQRPEEGSGTVLALTIIAALLVVTVVIAGLIGVVSANRGRRFECARGGGRLPRAH